MVFRLPQDSLVGQVEEYFEAMEPGATVLEMLAHRMEPVAAGVLVSDALPQFRLMKLVVVGVLVSEAPPQSR